jgi:hypothetical protein
VARSAADTSTGTTGNVSAAWSCLWCARTGAQRFNRRGGADYAVRSRAARMMSDTLRHFATMSSSVRPRPIVS